MSETVSKADPQLGLPCSLQAPSMQDHPNPSGGDPQELVTVCSWCCKVRVAPGTWEEKDTPKVQEILDRCPDDTLTHGICPSCSHEIVALLTA